MPLRGALRYSKDGTPPKRLRRLPLKGATPAARQSRLRGVPGRGFASRTSHQGLVRFAHFAPHFSQGGQLGCLIPHAFLLTRARHAVPLLLTPHFSSWATTRVAPTPILTPHSSFLTHPPSPLKDSRRTQTSSFRAQSRNPCPPALQLGCCDYAQHDGVCRTTVSPITHTIPRHSTISRGIFGTSEFFARKRRLNLSETRCTCNVSAANKPLGRSSRSGRAVWYSKPPLGRAEQRSSVRMKALALFERSEFASAPNAASSARNPKGTDVARLFLLTFFGEAKKVSRPPGRDPACNRSTTQSAQQKTKKKTFLYQLPTNNANRN